jgi:hypothetical protein
VIAVRLFPKEEVERQLWRRKCRKVKFHFTVPQEGPDKQCDEYTLRAILEELDRRGC